LIERFLFIENIFSFAIYYRLLTANTSTTMTYNDGLGDETLVPVVVLADDVDGDDADGAVLGEGLAVVEVLAGGHLIVALARARLRVEDGGRLAGRETRAAVQQAREELAAVRRVRQAIVVAEAQATILKKEVIKLLNYKLWISHQQIREREIRNETYVLALASK
jgi:hypothetical protein